MSVLLHTALLLFLSPSFSNQEGAARFDCNPEPDANQTSCEARGCVWEPPELWSDGPWCYFKPNVGYKLHTRLGDTFNLRKNDGPRNPWDTDFEQIQLRATSIGNVLNVHIGVDGRYEPPVEFARETSESSDEDALILSTDSSTDDLFTFSIVRKSSGTRLFDTSIGGLIFSNQFIQIATLLPSENMYGWGENLHQTLKHNFSSYLTWGMFARDQIPNSGSLDTMNVYGVHPYYMVLEPDGNAHGVLIVNSNAQEVTTAPGPSLIYRTIGGNLDMYFFPGPTPEMVTRQYLQFIGKPFLPAYWALGYQLSRYGYQGLAEMRERIQAVRDAGIPIDIGVADIDYMQRYQDFTTADAWSGFPEFVDEMHSWDMKLILIFDPAVDVTADSFARGVNASARFVEWPDAAQVQHSVQDMYPSINHTKIMLGVVWPDHHVAFPDFLDSSGKTQEWWIDEFAAYRQKLPFDAIWIDMNEPSVLGTNQYHGWYYNSSDHPDVVPLKCQTNGSEKLEMPPYKTHNVWRYGDESSGAFLSSNTLCMVASQDADKWKYYDVKSLYGLTESIHTQRALFKSTGKRGAVISRSTFPSSGRYAGHWLGDNHARWEDLRTSVIGAQEFNLFGIPYVGSDVCGFVGPSNEELCLRWQQMGAFHSFFRNHNDIKQPAQDPAVWPSVTLAARNANLFRYHYLPYLFSLHFVASQEGATVIRPVFFEYSTDPKTYDLSYQFMWGARILVAPVVHEGVTSQNFYLPDDTWFSLFDFEYGTLIPGNGYTKFPTPLDSRVPVFVRGGSVIPRQTPNMTTTSSRENPFELLVAPKGGRAVGSLYWDDGETILDDFESHEYHHFEFSYNETEIGAQLVIRHAHKSSIPLPSLDILEILDYPKTPDFDSFTINGSPAQVNRNASCYTESTKILYISTEDFIELNSPPADGVTEWILEWKNSEGPGGGVHGVFTVFPTIICVLFAVFW